MKRITSPLLLLALCLATALNAGLLWANARLAQAYGTLVPGGSLTPGVLLPPLTGRDERGQRVIIGYTGVRERTLVLAFEPNCPFCVANWAAWAELVSRLAPTGIRIAAVDLGGRSSRDFLNQEGLSSAVLLNEVDYLASATYQLSRVPATLLTNPQGVVEFSKVGPLQTSDIERLTRLCARAARY